MSLQVDTLLLHRSEDAVRIQNGFINRVFGWMTLGLAVTGFVAFGFARNPGWMVGHPIIFLALLGAQLVMVITLGAAIRRISPAAAFLGFIVFAALNGMTLSVIFLTYTESSIAQTFFVTSLTFGIMGLYGWVTKRDLTALGSLCVMGLIGLILASLVNLFTRSSRFDLIISAVGILLFVGLTAYDTQKIKRLAVGVGEGVLSEADSRRAAVLGALTLYLDFINLFLYLLRFFGRRK
ncbi:MAG: Bax inhibitor-1/YccA family protein [Lentisphaeria bacterium]|nr:Bax inhibitor-1/YccA family protein [Lentisphaeria bacterium]